MTDPTAGDADAPVDLADRDDFDPVTLEVLRNAAEAAAEEMNATLVRTAYSPNVTERRDCSCALFDADGELVSQAENIPVHLGAMPASVRAALEAFPPETLAPGDEILLNDPFSGGAHLPDLTLVAPIFAPREQFADTDDEAGGDGEDDVGDECGDERPELVAFAANRAHHADVGGTRSGAVAADATEIHQEGLRIPPVKLASGGSTNRAVLDLVLANVRTPTERRGDLRAQRAANETARRRVHELVERHGTDRLGDAFDAITDYSERRSRGAIESLPDGEARFADVLDDDGHGNEELAVVATVIVDGDEITVDFAGSAPQTTGPVNAVRAVTVSATYYAVRCVTDPDVPPNAGCYRPITVETEPGTIVDAEPPAAVVGGNLETSQRATDAVLGAFAELVPDRGLAGSQGTMNSVTFGGIDPRDGTPYAFYETQGGGMGARAGGDGLDGVHVHMSNTQNTPVEVLETAYPLRVRRYSLRPDSGGAGEYRGGLGLRRDVEILGHAASFSLLADRHRNPPYGLAGGEPGGTGAAWLLEDGDAVEAGAADGDDGEGDGIRLPSKVARKLPAGSVVSVRTPGAGGYGEPADRDPAAIAGDLELGKLTPERARAEYGSLADSRLGDGLDAE